MKYLDIGKEWWRANWFLEHYSEASSCIQRLQKRYVENHRIFFISNQRIHMEENPVGKILTKFWRIFYLALHYTTALMVISLQLWSYNMDTWSLRVAKFPVSIVKAFADITSKWDKVFKLNTRCNSIITDRIYHIGSFCTLLVSQLEEAWLILH